MPSLAQPDARSSGARFIVPCRHSLSFGRLARHSCRHSRSSAAPTRRALAQLALFSALLLAPAVYATAPPGAPAAPIHWQFGPRTLTLNGLGALAVPAGMITANRDEIRRFLEATGNPPAGDEIAIAAPNSLDWFLVFSFDAFEKLGVRKERPSVDDVVAALRRGNSQMNEARRRAGRETLDLLGWRDKPAFDQKTGRLTWSLDTQESGGRHNANRYWLLLTRNGVLTVELVTEEAHFEVARMNAEAILQNLGIAEEQGFDDPNSRDWLTVTFAVLAACLPAAGFTGLYLWNRRRQQRSEPSAS